MSKGILLDFEGTVARRADGELGPCLQEMRNLGYDVYRAELQAACDYVLRVEFPQKGYDDAEAFADAVLRHLGHKPKRTELMSLAPFLTEYHRFTLYADAERAVPALGKARKVAVISGLPGFLVRPLVEPLRADLAVITPKEARAALPHPQVFETAAQALNLKPRDVTVVSADCEDGLAVPNELGFRTVHVRRPGQAACPHAAATISSLDDLHVVLRPTPSRTQAPAPVTAAKA